jgi:hypothetical protein
MGWLDALAETSLLFTQYHQEHGLPAYYVPWGTSANHYKTLHLDRDIDVLWMGKRRTRKRSIHIDKVRRDLQLHGFNMYVVDGIENPFVFDEERTRLINRSRITLNVHSNRHDNSFHMRFHMVAGNGSMVVSENLLPHYVEYLPGVHYAAAELDNLSNSVRYYLENEEERAQIAHNAFQLVTGEMTMANSLRKIIELAHTLRREKRLATDSI